jgi:hypothetical protein
MTVIAQAIRELGPSYSVHKRANAGERIVKAFYEQDSWLIHRVMSRRTPVRGHWLLLGADIWGAFDLVGMHRTKGFLFSQVKVAKDVGDAKRKIGALPWPLFNNGYTIQVCLVEAMAREVWVPGSLYKYGHVRLKIASYDPSSGSWSNSEVIFP